jgi:PAS domain S-box-containing protein
MSGDSTGTGSMVHADVLERVSDGVLAMDDDFRYTYVNERAEALLGMDADALLGERVWDVFPHVRDTVTEHEFRAAMSEQEPRAYEHYDDELDAWFEVRCYPDADGLSVYFTDVSERVQRERDLERLTEEYETLLANTTDAIFLLDVDDEGTVRYERFSPSDANPSNKDGDDLEGRTPTEVFGPEVGEQVAANYRRCVEAGEPISYEDSIQMDDGEVFWHTNLAPVVVDGEVTRVVGVARNTTARVEHERDLERENERLAEFASVISHDLRNPLTVAQGHTAMLAEVVDESLQADLAAIADALDRMEAIVEDTLTLARQGETVGETYPVSLTGLVGSCWRMVDTETATLHLEADATVRGDSNRLKQVFENLFRNAVKHGSTSPRSHTHEDSVERGSTGSRAKPDEAIEHGGAGVTVTVGRLGDDGLFVEDDGPGIPRQERERVFEAGHSTSQAGTGFGLSIVKRIVEAHGWDVHVTEGRDGGARFEFTGVDFVD